MKKAVILVKGKQYLVSEGQELDVDYINDADKTSLSLDSLLVVEGEKIEIGRPTLSSKTTAEITIPLKKADKVTSIRYKAKKRVHKVHGHRRHLTTIKIKKIG